jgi:hypothetical protein
MAEIGVYYYANGDKYDGEWSEDKVNGEGKKLLKLRNLLLWKW